MHPFGEGMRTAAFLAVACFGLPGLVSRTLLDASALTTAVALGLGAAAFAMGCWRRRSVLGLDQLARPARRGPTIG
jgi:hypothetical protein